MAPPRRWAAGGTQRAKLLLAFRTGLAVAEPWYLVSNAKPSVDLIWALPARGLRSERAAAHRSPLAAGLELCVDRPEGAAAVRGQFRQSLAGLGTHPPAGSGALHCQPRRTATAERAMVHAL